MRRFASKGRGLFEVARAPYDFAEFSIHSPHRPTIHREKYLHFATSDRAFNISNLSSMVPACLPPTTETPERHFVLDADPGRAAEVPGRRPLGSGLVPPCRRSRVCAPWRSNGKSAKMVISGLRS